MSLTPMREGYDANTPETPKDQPKPSVNLSVITSPSVALAVRAALTEKALQLRDTGFSEYVLEIVEKIKTYLEQVDVCDCAICVAKKYVDEKLGNKDSEAQTVKPGFVAGGSGHYL